MNLLKKSLAAAGALSLAVTPMIASAASANPAGALSLQGASAAQGAPVRAGTNLKKSSGVGAALFPILIIAIVGTTIGFAVADDGDSDSN